MNFAVLWLFAKVFSTKFGGVVSFGAAQASNLQKVFSINIVFFTNLQKFSPSKIYRYAVAKGVLGWAMVGIGDGRLSKEGNNFMHSNPL